MRCAGLPMIATHRDAAHALVPHDSMSMTVPNPAEKAATRLRLVDLPPFPAIAIRALQLVSNSETRLSELHDLICTDPAFAAEILRLVNSPLYGIRTEITSTLQAAMLLGFERVKGVAL